MFPKQANTKMDGIQMVSIWFSDIFPCHVRNMVFQTYLVASGAENLREAIKLFWIFRIPWGWTYSGSIFPDWVAQFSFGFYSLMLTSLLIGLIVMIFFKPRTWCAFCPMGTMTQAICKLRNRKAISDK